MAEYHDHLIDLREAASDDGAVLPEHHDDFDDAELASRIEAARRAEFAELSLL